MKITGNVRRSILGYYYIPSRLLSPIQIAHNLAPQRHECRNPLGSSSGGALQASGGKHWQQDFVEISIESAISVL